MKRWALLMVLLSASFAMAQTEDNASHDSPPASEAPTSQEVDPIVQGVVREMEGGSDIASGNSLFQDVDRPTGTTALLQGIFALTVVLALILFVYYGVRKWGKNVPLLAGANLGTVMGRIHLERGTALHFVRTGGRVLVVGVNGNSISLVADFDPDAFDQAAAESQPTQVEAKSKGFNPDSFLAQLQASSASMSGSASSAGEARDDDEIAALRGDIQRLQQSLREETRESQD